MKQELGQETYIGLDTHRETLYGTATDNKGEIICSYQFPNNKDALKEFLKNFKPWNTSIAIEACGTWRGCWKILRKLGYKVKLANPLKCHQIAKDKKTDEVDSKILADLLRTNFLPEVFIPSDEILELRDLTRHKCNLTRLQVSIKNKIKMNLLREGINYKSKLWNSEGIIWLKNLKDEKLDDFITQYELLEKQKRKIDKKIGQIAITKRQTALLQTIPGIGKFGAVLIYAEIAEIKRFPDPKHLHGYSGMCPGIQQSGSKTRCTKKKEVNHWLKWIIGQCSGRSTMINCRFQKYYFKIKNKKGWKTARKAVGRKMLTVIWHVLNEETPYQES